MTLNEVRCRSLPTSVSGRITSFPPFIGMLDRPHFAPQHNVAKDNAENFVFFVVVMIVLNHFAPRHNVAKDNAENSDFIYFSRDDCSKPIPSRISKPVDETQEVKKSSQEYQRKAKT